MREREPQRIGINTSRAIGPADNLSYAGHQQLVETLGEPYASRLVSAEKLLSDFRSRRTTTEIAAFAEAGELSREIAERAFSNEVITPDVTMLEDVAWWMMDQLLARGLDTSFGMPSVYVTGPDGIEATSSDRIIRRGDLLMIDWGVGYLNMYTDMKRMAYVLEDGEAEAPASFQRAFDKGREARAIITETIRPGIAAAQAEQEIYDALAEAGFQKIGFNQPSDDPAVTAAQVIRRSTLIVKSRPNPCWYASEIQSSASGSSNRAAASRPASIGSNPRSLASCPAIRLASASSPQ